MTWTAYFRTSKEVRSPSQLPSQTLNCRISSIWHPLQHQQQREEHQWLQVINLSKKASGTLISHNNRASNKLHLQHHSCKHKTPRDQREGAPLLCPSALLRHHPHRRCREEHQTSWKRNLRSLLTSKLCWRSCKSKSQQGHQLRAGVLLTVLPFKRRAAFNKKIMQMAMVKSKTNAERGIDTQVMKKMAVSTSLRQEATTIMVETTIINNRGSSSSRFLKWTTRSPTTSSSTWCLKESLHL